ncbi:hypothetical protein [Mycolicibacter minnesotensis]
MTLASTGNAAMLTVGLSLYPALVLVVIAVAISSARKNQRRRAIYAAVTVGVLVLIGLAGAIFSSIA